MSPNPTLLFQASSTFLLIKIGIEALLVLFFIFLLVVLKQLSTMNTIITQQQLFNFLRVFTFLLLAATLALFLLTLVLV